MNKVRAGALRVLIFGGSGLVGSKFITLHSQTFELKVPRANEVNILNKDHIAKAIEQFNPDSIINFAAYTNVEEAENQKGDKNEIAYQINVVGAKNVAEVCRDTNKHLVYISTDYVFDGEKEWSSYVETDAPNPINWYGQTKYLGEQEVNNTHGKGVIVRISMPYSSYYEAKLDVARFFLEQLRSGNHVKGIDDQYVNPTLVSDIAHALKTLIEVQAQGIYHVSSTDTTTPLDFVKTIAKTFHLDYSLIQVMKLDEYNKQKKAKLLRNSSLNPAKFEKEFGEGILHTIEEGLIIFKKEIDERTKI